jgi:hypothetical protein
MSQNVSPATSSASSFSPAYYGAFPNPSIVVAYRLVDHPVRGRIVCGFNSYGAVTQQKRAPAAVSKPSRKAAATAAVPPKPVHAESKGDSSTSRTYVAPSPYRMSMEGEYKRQESAFYAALYKEDLARYKAAHPKTDGVGKKVKSMLKRVLTI